MSMIVEYRRAIADAVEHMEQIDQLAAKEERDLTEEETVDYGAYRDLVKQKQAAIVREEERKATRSSLGMDKAQPPAVLKLGRGDDEIKSMAYFVRTGDTGSVSHLVQADETGTRSVVLHIPTIREMRAVVDSTMNITTTADGGSMVPTGFVQDVALRKNELMLAPRLGCRRVPGKGTTVNYPYEAADPEDFAATAEQSDAHDVAYERDAGNTAVKAFTLAKKTRKIDLTEELLEDNDVDLMGYIADRIARQVGQTHNGLLLTEVAANGTALKTFASATAIAQGEPEDIVYNDTIAAYLEDDSGSASWVMRWSTLGNIRSLVGDQRQYASMHGEDGLLGFPVYRSNKAAATAASAKDCYFGNWDYVGYREAPEMRFIMDPYSVDGLVIMKYSFRAVYGVLQAGAIGYGAHPSA